MIVAVESGFLLHLADADDEAWDVYSALLEHEKGFCLVATPTAVETLNFLFLHPEKKIATLARDAWKGLNSEWKISSVEFNDAQRKISWVLSYHFREINLLDKDRRFESEVLAEAIMSADLLLASNDSTYAEIDFRWLAFETRMLGMSEVVPFTTAELKKILSR